MMDTTTTCGDKLQLSLIFPCYNEESRLPASLKHAREYLIARGWSFEILVVDDGSRDRTVAIAEEIAADDPRIRVLHYQPNQGKGYAVAYGAGQAQGEWVLFSDADLSTPIEEIEKFAGYVAQGYDVVIGSRAMKESNLAVRQPWWRERAGRLMNFLIRRASGLKFRDTQCGFKLFTRRAARDVFPNLQVKRWMFDVEALILAQKFGYRVAEVPVTWINSGESRVKLSHTANVFRELIQIRVHWWRRQPQRTASGDTDVALQPSR